MRVHPGALLAVLALLLGAACVAPLTETERSDQGITARLQERMKAQRGVDLRYVTLDVHDRVVTLSGSVQSWENSRDLEVLARRTRGVEQVMNNLLILEQ